MGEGAHHAVHEAVDGAHSEIGIVVEYAFGDDGGALAKGVAVDAEGKGKVSTHVAIRPLQGNGVEFAQDALFHFVGGLVGEGDGQNAAETGGECVAGGREGQFQILADEGVGFARARRSTTNDKTTGIHNKLQIYKKNINYIPVYGK